MSTVKEILKKTNGRFTKITFVRSTDTSKTTKTKNETGKIGEVSTRIFRTGVKKGVKGVGMPYTPEDKGLVVLYWVGKGFRTIKEKNIIGIQCGDLNYYKEDGILVLKNVN